MTQLGEGVDSIYLNHMGYSLVFVSHYYLDSAVGLQSSSFFCHIRFYRLNLKLNLRNPFELNQKFILV